MEFKSIMHVTFFTNQLDEMVRFYTEVLGGEVKILTRAKAYLDRPESPYYLAAKANPDAIIIVYIEIAPGQFIELFPAGPQQLPHRQWNDSVDYSHFAVLVDDLQETMARLEVRGLAFDTEPSCGPSGTWQECKRHGIAPFVTMVHYDIPVALKQKYGDWRNTDLCDAYVAYARVLFENFGPDEVPYWLTYNEYNATIFYGAVDMTGDRSIHTAQELYDEAHRMQVMQAQVMKLCHEMCPGAKIGPVPNITTSYPLTSSPEDYIAALNMDDLRNNMYLDSLVYGRYPKSVLRWLDHQGVKLNILPGDMEALAETHPDFIGFNCYGNDTVAALGWDDGVDLNDLAAGDNTQLSYLLALAQKPGIGEASLNEHFVPNPADGSPYDPWCLRITARRLTDRYHLPLMITECGTARPDKLEADGTVHDQYRIEFFREVLKQLEIGIEEGADIMGFCPWSAMDVVSTREGITKRYGFVYVDRDEDDEKAAIAEMKRYRKDSFYWYQRVIATNGEELGDL